MKEKAINFIKRQFSPLKLFSIMKTLIAVGIALVLVTLIILFTADDPGEALRLLLIGPLTTARRFGNVLEMMIPLTFTALAICIMFKARQFTMIAEGAFFLGGLGASIIALTTGFSLTPVLAIAVGAIIGAVLALIPAILKAKLGASELVASLMLNYVVFYFGQYIFNNFMRDASANSSVSHPFPQEALLPVIIDGTRVHAGIIIAVVMVILVYLFLNKTRWGYAIRMVGINPKFVLYSGMPATGVVLYSQVAGGAVAGIGGAVEILGMYKRFSWTMLPGYGFDGIIIATLARENPIGVIFAAFFLAYLRVGADIMSRSTNVTNEVIAIIQGVIILLVSAEAFLSFWRHKLVVKDSQQREKALKGGEANA